ncbi:carbohydrate kinase [Pseudoduganella plicata]|uniref:Carbohydrate kinase n=1 Tax=Pseudoduganella plicata TaxID=321984 RepID=A0A4P7BEX0_9BURK|nr:carbohydrate kinase [Pseudoduganella plicata]QBQ36055.1 carbohydrate kinase [Pseudoduganella plicata]GGY78431.1 fructokinase [Pseudoduganella plicata]
MAHFPEFVSAGEALTDLIVTDPQQQHWLSVTGGSTWNVARTMAALGLPSAFAGAISRDVFGDALWRATEAAGLDTRFTQRLDKAPLLAVVHRLDPPTYFFIGDDSADLHFDAALLPDGWRTHCRWLHFGGISLAREPLASKLVALAREAKAAGIGISFDPNYRRLMDERYDPTLRAMTALADVVKVSEEDLVGLFRHDDTVASFAQLREFNPAARFLYTKGAEGASLHIGAGSWQVAAPAVQVQDTVGAGDASIAAFVHSLLREAGRTPLQHLQCAVAAGAAACLGAGATPPSLAQIAELMAAMD